MIKKRVLLSVVIPVYRAYETLSPLVKRLTVSINTITSSYEIILVDDGSPDSSWNKITELSQHNPQVKGIKLSRNFGQHAAITAGLNHQNGEWIVVMDCDLQDKPEEIPGLFKTAQTGYDIVLAQRQKRQDNFAKVLFSSFFYRLLSYLTETQLDSSIANFGIYHHKVITAVGKMHDTIRFFPTMIQWVGFKSTKIEVQHAPRTAGATTYSIKKLFSLAVDIMLAFSDKPLRLVVSMGLFVAFLSLLMALWYAVKYIRGEIVVLGWATLVLSLWFLSGMIIVVLGLVGLYVGKIFEKVKQRPNYLVDKVINTSTSIKLHGKPLQVSAGRFSTPRL